MATYTRQELQDAVALFGTTATALQNAYDGMYAAAISGISTYTTDPITPQSVRDKVKATLEAAPASFTVTINQQDPTKLQISWA